MSTPLDQKISQLSEKGTLEATDKFVVQTGGGNSQISGATLLQTFVNQVPANVVTFNGRNGAVVLQSSDLNGLNGSGLTGIGAGTGGVVNTGSTTVGADSDADGVGVIDLQTRALTRLRIANDGALSVLGRGGALWAPFQTVFYAAEYASFAAAVAAIGVARASLVVSSLSAVATNLTVPANIHLVFVGPGGLQPANGVTILNLAAVTAGPYQIFYNALASQGTISFAGNQSGIRLNIRWWGAVGDDATDNTAILNAVIAAAHTMQVATIDVPPGIYRIDGTATGAIGYKARVNLPAVTPAGEWDQITIEGTSAGMGVFGTVVNPNLPTTKGSIFKTTQTGDAMIGGTNAGSFTAVKLILKNLVLRCPDNPNVIALDMSYVLGFDFDELIIDTGRYTTACVQPTNPGGIGLRGVVFAAGGDQVIRKLTISGFYTGMTNTEQTYAERIVISGCWVALEMQKAVHNSRFEYIDVFNNNTHIKVTDRTGFSIGMMNIELATLACMPTLPAWQQTVQYLDDPSNLGRGSIYYQNSTACASDVDDVFKRSGGKYFNLRQISKNIPLSFMVGRSAVQSILAATPTLISWTTTEFESELALISTALPFTVFTVPISGLYEIAAMVEMEPTAAGTTFQLNLLKGATKIDNDVKPGIGAVWNVVLKVRRQALLEQGDQLSFTIYHDHGTSRNVAILTQAPRFSMLKLQN